MSQFMGDEVRRWLLGKTRWWRWPGGLRASNGCMRASRAGSGVLSRAGRALEYLRGRLSPAERQNDWQLAEQAGDATPDWV